MNIQNFSSTFIYKNKVNFSGIPFQLPILSKKDYDEAYIFTITPKFCYRSDKICNEIWGDDSLEFILFYINKINSVSELYIGKTLYYFDNDTLSAKGLIK